jgi:hypothetical protein
VPHVPGEKWKLLLIASWFFLAEDNGSHIPRLLKIVLIVILVLVLGTHPKNQDNPPEIPPYPRRDAFHRTWRSS